MKPVERVLRRNQHDVLLFDRNEYARRAIAARVEPAKVKRIFGLSDTAYRQLEGQAKEGVL